MIWRGEIYDVDLGHPIGHEPAVRRPAVVVSADILNNGAGGLVIVVPITSKGYGLRSHVELDDDTSGLARVSYARCDQVRAVSVERLARRRGAVSHNELESVRQSLRFVLDL